MEFQVFPSQNPTPNTVSLYHPEVAVEVHVGLLYIGLSSAIAGVVAGVVGEL